MITDTLRVPEWVDVVPCAMVPQVFGDPALDPDPNVWSTLDDADKHEVATDKRAAEDRALEYCAGCPILDECRAWAIRTNVFGVAGGLRNWERNGKDAVDTYLESGRLPDRDHLIEVWLGKGQSMAWIADRLRVPVRAVTRVRDRLAETEEETAAREALEKSGRRWSRVSPATVALYDLLVEAGTVSKSGAVEHMVSYVPKREAFAAVPKNRKFKDKDAKRVSGATRYVHNVIRVAIRDGNIIQDGEKGHAMLRLNPELAESWKQWREATLAETA